MAKLKCGQLTGSVVGEGSRPGAEETEMTSRKKEEEMGKILVGKNAPDFQAPGFHKGEIKAFKLSDYLGKWVLICFYPGDYTFV